VGILTTIEDAIVALLDVAVGNYTNYSKVPTIKIMNEDDLWFMPPREIGVKIIPAEDGEGFQDHQGTVLFMKQRCSVVGIEVKKATCDNLFKDVRGLIAAGGYTITQLKEPKPLANNKFQFTINVEKIQGV